MNKNRIFAIFILVALLITCVGVSFASNDFDDAYMDEISVDDNLEIDDSDLDNELIDDDLSSDLDDEDPDLDDSDLDDEDWDDDWDLDDEDWDDEDWDDDWDDEDWDDDWDLDDEDYDYSDIERMEEGNYTEDGKVFYYCLTFYKNGKALGCSYMLPDSDSSDENKTGAHNENASSASGSDDTSSPDSYTAPTTNANHDSIAKTIDYGDLKDTITYDNFKNTVKNSTATHDDSNTSTKNTIKNETNAFESTNDNLGIFALLALLFVSLVVII